MKHPTCSVRKNEGCLDATWPVRARSVRHLGETRAVTGVFDSDFADLNLVREHFPSQRVTPGGGVITVPPQTRAARKGCRTPVHNGSGPSQAPPAPHAGERGEYIERQSDNQSRK